MCTCMEEITDVCMMCAWRRSLMCACVEEITDVYMYGGDH